MGPNPPGNPPGRYDPGRRSQPARNITGNWMGKEIADKILQHNGRKTLNLTFPIREHVRSMQNGKVFTNHFSIQVDPKKTFYAYRIEGLPDGIAKKAAKHLVEALLRHVPWLQRPHFATDYATKIVSTENRTGNHLGPFIVHSSRGASLSLTLAALGAVNFRQLENYTMGITDPTDVEDLKRDLNMLVSAALKPGCIFPKANKFFIDAEEIELGNSLCTKSGLFYSTKPGMRTILLNTNTCTSAFYRRQLVSAFLGDRQTFRNEGERQMMLVGLRVKTTYPPKIKNNDTGKKESAKEPSYLRIAEVGGPVKTVTFKYQDGDAPAQDRTVQEHYRKEYGFDLHHATLAINCGSRASPMWYPADRLEILPNQLFSKVLPGHLTSRMLSQACKFPDDTLPLILHRVRDLFDLRQGSGQIVFPNMPGVSINPYMLNIQAASLMRSVIRYGGDNQVKPGMAKWNLANKKFLRTARKTFNPCIFAVSSSRFGKNDKMVNDYFNFGFYPTVAESYDVAEFDYPPISWLSEADLARGSDHLHKVMGFAHKQGANFFILMMGDKSIPTYSMFKDLADRAFGVQSSCLVYNRSWDNQAQGKQHWANIAMKINLKTGGGNHTSDGVGKIMKNTLVLGADVTHPGSGALTGTPSIAAIVGSVNSTADKFLGSMRLQSKLQPFNAQSQSQPQSPAPKPKANNSALEEIQDVHGMVLERIEAWSKANQGALPENILYYRDGVSESQYAGVKEREVYKIRQAFSKFAETKKRPNANVKITAVVVAKRHHTRFFAQKEGRILNPDPGLLVDTIVTSPYYQDFFLQSHIAIKGTAKPAHYFMLYNEMGLTEERFQQFSFDLCHTYVRTTSPVSYPPPAYYADRLCERGRCYLRSFLVPTSDRALHDAYNNEKRRIQKDIEERRKKRSTKAAADNANISSSSSSNSNSNNKANATLAYKQVQENRKADKDEENSALAAWTMRKIKERFARGPAKNPWCDSIADTMFWM